jgi:hypothetical protein
MQAPICVKEASSLPHRVVLHERVEVQKLHSIRCQFCFAERVDILSHPEGLVHRPRQDLFFRRSCNAQISLSPRAALVVPKSERFDGFV